MLEDASGTVVAVDIAEGAHHLDLMFSHPSDSALLRAARRLEMQHVRRWMRQKSAARGRTRLSLRARMVACGTGLRCDGGHAYGCVQA